jgi:hypothetical protein
VQQRGRKRRASRAQCGARYRTTVLTSVRSLTSLPYSCHLLRRCARVLSTISRLTARGLIADVYAASAILDRRRHSSAVEQLFRKSPPVCAVLQAWRPDTNGHSYQLFVSRGCSPRNDAAGRMRPNDSDYRKSFPNRSRHARLYRCAMGGRLMGRSLVGPRCRRSFAQHRPGRASTARRQRRGEHRDQ